MTDEEKLIEEQILEAVDLSRRITLKKLRIFITEVMSRAGIPFTRKNVELNFSISAWHPTAQTQELKFAEKTIGNIDWVRREIYPSEEYHKLYSLLKFD